jgi:hypothetical protein
VRSEKNEKRNFKFSKRTRKEAIKLAEYQCECCGITLNGKKSSQAEVHHLLPMNVVSTCCPEISALAIDNLANTVVLCHECHSFLHKNEDGYKILYEVLVDDMKYFSRQFSKKKGKKYSPKSILSSLRIKKEAALDLLKEELNNSDYNNNNDKQL